MERNRELRLQEEDVLVDVGGASGPGPEVIREKPEVLGAQGEQSRGVDPSAVFEVPEEGLPGA